MGERDKCIVGSYCHYDIRIHQPTDGSAIHPQHSLSFPCGCFKCHVPCNMLGHNPAEHKSEKHMPVKQKTNYSAY